MSIAFFLLRRSCPLDTVWEPKGKKTRHGGLKIEVKVNTPSDPAENRRRPTFLKEEGKMIKTSPMQALLDVFIRF